MRRSAIRNLVIFILVWNGWSCSGPGVQPNAGRVDSFIGKEAGGEVEPRWKSLDTSLYFAGIYINAAYVDSITHNHSQWRSQQAARFIKIPDSTLEATIMIDGFHEGEVTMVVVKDGERYRFYDSELTQAYKEIRPGPPGHLRIGDEDFIALKHPDPDKQDWGILEELLFSGKYQREDGGAVEFGLDGRISGLDSIGFYQPIEDYSETMYSKLDGIRLGRSSDKLNEYIFRFDDGALSIYRINCLSFHDGCDSAEAGDLLWKLRRLPG